MEKERNIIVLEQNEYEGGERKQEKRDGIRNEDTKNCAVGLLQYRIF